MNRAVDRTSLRRILLSVDAIGDAWDYVFELATGLSSRGAEVLIAAFSPPPVERLVATARAREACRAGDLLLEVVPGALTGAAPAWRVAAAATPWLERLVSAWAPDVVHLNTLAHAGLGCDAPVISVVHARALAWYDASAQRFPGPVWARQEEAIARGLRRSTLVLTPATAIADAVSHRYGAFPRALVLDTQAHVDLVSRAWSLASHLHLYEALTAEARAWRAVTDIGDYAVLR